MSTPRFPEHPLLLVDDDEHVMESLFLVLSSHGIDNIIQCRDSRDAMGIIRREPIDVILLDLAMPHISGEELLQSIHDEFPQIPVIVVTGTNEVAAAVECMRKGAFDYMVKAVEESRLVSGVRRAIEIRSLRRHYRNLRDTMLAPALANPGAFSHIVTQNAVMGTLFRLVESVARTNEPVLITGETGTGKELIAKAVHTASAREGPFVEVNVAGLDDSMFSDTLFGHRKGAYTGAVDERGGLVQEAGTGTLLLDEIGDLAIASQVKLLRLLDTREYYPLGSDLTRRTAARMLFSTNCDLAALMAEGKFRKDLFYRLATHEIHVPPLRERRDDLALLLDRFLDDACADLGRKKPSIPRELLDVMDGYPFPGNIRELRAMTFDAVSRQESPALALESFKRLLGREIPHKPDRQEVSPFQFPERLPTIKQATALLIEEAMKRAHGNQSVAAGLLGVTHQALNRRLKK